MWDGYKVKSSNVVLLAQRVDSNVRVWVMLPIVFITFFTGVLRHSVSQLLHSNQEMDLEQLSDRSWTDSGLWRAASKFLSGPDKERPLKCIASGLGQC
ncbi:unnamed protein product [Merluccius merluccius]